MVICTNCLHSFRTENKPKSHEKVCKNNNFSEIAIQSWKGNISEFSQYIKSDKISYIIYADIESLIKKVDGCLKNLEDFSTAKIGEHIPCGYSMSTFWGFDHKEKKHTLYRAKDCVKKFCESLREHTKICYKSMNYCKVRDHCYYAGKYRGTAHSICNLKFIEPNEIPLVFITL